MENVRVSYYINQTAAVLAGKAKYGTVTAVIDPVTLTEEQREELVKCHCNGDAYELDGMVDGSSNLVDGEREVWPSISEPADDVPARLLNARIALRKASDAKKAVKDAEQAAERAKLKAIDDEVGANPEAFISGEGNNLQLRKDIQGLPTYGNESVLPNIIALRKTVEARNSAARETARAEQKAKQRAEWGEFLKAHGTQDQNDRFNADCLPSEERDELAEEVIFDSLLKDVPVYEKLHADDVTHDNDECYGEIKFRGSCAGDYDHATKKLTPNKYGTAVEFDSSQWKAFNDVVARLPMGNVKTIGTERMVLTLHKVDLEIRRHEGYCDDCEASTARLGVRVTIRWNGSTFEREYAL